MRATLPVLALLIALSLCGSALAYDTKYDVKETDIYRGYIVKKIWLNSYAKPDVAVSGIAYTGNVALPQDAQPSDPTQFNMSLGMERKRPFVVVRIPAYVAGQSAGIVNRVSSLTLSITEHEQAKNKTLAKFSDVPNSALNTGTWYKMGITKTGFYRIDNSFLTTMGVNPANINPANIRILGNGGNMLSEDNSVARPSDLVENSVQVNGNGDNVFDNGESVIFYGVGPMAWHKDSVNQLFVHQVNLYSDTAYYFISFDSGPGKRISSQPSAPTGNVSVSTYNYYEAHELDLVSPANIGKNWYGEQFSQALGNNVQTFSFNLGSSVANLRCAVSMAAITGSTSSNFSVKVNGNDLGTSFYSQPTTGDNAVDLNYLANTVACNSQVANVTVTFTPGDAIATGYLDFIELNARPALAMSGDQMGFRDWASVGSGHVASYRLAGAGGNTRVWDVTDPQTPVIMNGSFDGSAYNFSQDAAWLHEFAATNGNSFYTPKYVGTVPNQNLHGLGATDLIIVTYPGYLSQANKLADHHRSHDHMRVAVATTTQVYNEFSSGAQDISAIRDFAKMFYDRAGSYDANMPKYLLVFGGASYDYKNRVVNNSNFVPVFESAESFNDLDAFCTDDFYGFLDDSENIENNIVTNALDIGVGRLPARSVDDANAMVNKIINYDSVSTLGPWRISTTVVADKGCRDAAGDHMADAEAMAGTVTDAGTNNYNQQKIYVDAIPIVNTPAGPRCPNANSALNQQVYNGTFLINYNGHGNPTVWSSERILTSDDFNQWNNNNSLPFMVTATCDFGEFDRPQVISSAEQLVVRKAGGVIAVLTTTQAVYAYYNHELNVQYLGSQFTRNTDGTWNTFGEACRRGKNETYSKPGPHDAGEIANFRKFSLLGDPALTPAFPEYAAKIDSAIDGYTGAPCDTIKALGSYIMKGSIRDNSGHVMSGFNGTTYVTIFDKPRNITTISGCSSVYALQDNIVYKGRVTVTNGLFSFTFITPRDVNYAFGAGKISLYADNGSTDAAGNNDSLIVGGYSDHPVLSSEPPTVKAYINDTLFRDGGITGSNTSLYATFYDKTGINVSGTDIGHDLTAVLDGNVDAPYILNNYYETAPNTYQYGHVSFAIGGLAEGRHSLKVRAWDVNDNVGEGTVNFVVVNGKVTDIEQLGNYPNPFSSSTHFVFEHNHPFEQVEAEIEIYNVGGALVRNLKSNFTTTDSRTIDVTWDGTDNHGSLLPSGVYVYRLNLTADGKYKSSAYQKLVIVR